MEGFLDIFCIILLVIFVVCALGIGLCAAADPAAFMGNNSPEPETLYHVTIKTDNETVKEWSIPYEVYSDKSGYVFVGADGSSIHFEVAN